MIKFIYISDKGTVRENNEDCAKIFAKDNYFFALLSDGMGGHKYGDVASNIVINYLSSNFGRNFVYTSSIQTKKFIEDSIATAKKEMKKIAAKNKEMENMGTTLVGCIGIPEHRKIFIFNVGDSRCYFYLNTKKLIKVTIDQNLASQWKKNGYDYHNNKNEKYARYLTSAIGPNIPTTIDITEIKDNEYDLINKIMLTSDGVHEFVEHIDLEACLSKDDSISNIANAILDQAILNSSNDNMTIALLELDNEK
ncbi:PP2C family protein-serine/threonine phosphatase [Mycoplasma sp. 4423]